MLLTANEFDLGPVKDHVSNCALQNLEILLTVLRLFPICCDPLYKNRCLLVAQIGCWFPVLTVPLWVRQDALSETEEVDLILWQNQTLSLVLNLKL
jgi:hypothetical protein